VPARLWLPISPVVVFTTLSLLFGTIILLATPPLRGPDETAHFLRAYGVAQGDIVPSHYDAAGRKGIFVPSRPYEGFDFFERVRVKEKERGFTYGPVFQAYFSNKWVPNISERSATFVPYAGSEGYSPAAYLPQAAAAFIARALDLDFLPTIYLMRFSGLAALTALIAYAMSKAPKLPWALLTISMLPSAIYGRSVINADGSALAGAMVVVAWWVGMSISPQLHRLNRYSFWMTLCALTKPPNLVFVLLLPMPGMRMPRWHLLALTTAPAIGLAMIWTFSSGAETATWRMVEITGTNLDAFDPSAKLVFLFNHPLHFIVATGSALRGANLAEFWLQVIGVLGLFDTVLRSWAYPALSMILFSTFLVRLPLDLAARLRIALLSGVTILAYFVVVYLIAYLVFTPMNADSVWGVQGRYFVPVLPLIALIVATLLNWAPNNQITTALAILASVLSGGACVEAILRIDWKLLI
jgi:uncharacterized membrane protein